MTTAPSDVVRSFYDAVRRGDAQAISDLLADSFREDAAFVWPDGLPYGGRVEGATRLGRLFVGMATSGVAMGPDDVRIVSIVDGGDQVAAQLEFNWRAPGTAGAIPSGAVELWSFDAGRVSEVRAYYWDTAACQDLVNNTHAASADA